MDLILSYAVNVAVTTLWFPFRDFAKMRHGNPSLRLDADFVTSRYRGLALYPQQPALIAAPPAFLMGAYISYPSIFMAAVGASGYGCGKSFVKQLSTAMGSTRNFHGDSTFKSPADCITTLTQRHGVTYWLRGSVANAFIAFSWQGLAMYRSVPPRPANWGQFGVVSGMDRSRSYLADVVGFTFTHAFCCFLTTPLRNSYRLIMFDSSFQHAHGSGNDIAAFRSWADREKEILIKLFGHVVERYRFGGVATMFQGTVKTIGMTSLPFGIAFAGLAHLH